MHILHSVILCIAVLVLGVQCADKSPVVLETTPRHSDNVASASVTSTSAKPLVPASKNTKRSNDQDEHFSAAETHQYDDRQYIQPQQYRPRPQQLEAQPQQQLISRNEYLALIREQESAQAAAQESTSPHPYGKLSSPQEQLASAYYARNPGHPLAGSSLEKEIEKLISSNGQQYNPAHEQQKIGAPQHPSHSEPIPQLNHPEQPQQQQQLRSPVLFKNQNDIVYIPYQQQVQRDQYQRPAQGPSGITKAKVQLISGYPPVRTPFPGEAIEYGRVPQALGGLGFVPTKQQESFKELYMQQQRENHLKRIQAQAAQAQAHQQQQATDNLNQQSHAQPLSISLLPQKPAQQSQTPPTPPPQTPANQPASSNIAQFAERLFQTPLDQQKPLSQEQFKALVAAGYPVQAVPVPIAVSGPKAPHQASAPQASSYPPQLIQRYSPSTASLAHPQPFAHHPKQPQSIVQEQYEQQTNAQVQRPTPAPQHHQQVQLQAHRFYPQRQYSQPQPNPHTTYQYRVPEGGVPQQQHHHQQPPTNPRQQQQHGPYTYILQQGENEESAAEQLRQQIIQQINAQSQKGAPSNGQHVPPQPQSGGFIPTRLEYSQQSPAPSHRVTATPSPPPSKPLTEEQKEYYKRLEYY